MARIEPASLAPGISLPGAASLVSNRRLAVAVALGIAVAAGLLTSFVAPRGPTTTANALFVMAVGLLLGTAGGALVRSRWSLAALFVVYFLGIEAGRLDVVGLVPGRPPRQPLWHRRLRPDPRAPSPSWCSRRSPSAFWSGAPWRGDWAGRRVPLGGGCRSAPRWSVSSPRRLAVLVAWPASTPPVMGPDGQPAPRGIAEMATVRLGGADQTVMIRAADPDKPVLLYLSGGPGQSDLAYARVLLEPLDGRLRASPSGISAGAAGPMRRSTRPRPLTLEQAVADTVELSEYLRDRFGEQKIYLLGESWGTTLGVLAVQDRPDLFHAYIGSGQMVSQRETDRIIWRDLLAYADRTGNGALYDQILTLGEPPYRDTPWANSVVMGYYPLLETPYAPPAAYMNRGNASGVGPYGVLASEYAFIDKVNVIRGLIDMFSLMYPQLQGIDFRTDVTALEVPVYVLDGAHELAGRRDLAQEWFEALTAPHKE